MSAKYTFLAWGTPIDGASLKLALLQLANNADDNGFSYYSISKMAIACGMSERTFMRRISELENIGILTVERRANRPSIYSLVGDEMEVKLQQAKISEVTKCRLQTSEVTKCHLQTPEVTKCHPEVTDCHLVGDKLSPDPNSTPNTYPKYKSASPKVEACPYQQILDVYHEVLPMVPAISVLTAQRKTKIKNFWNKFGFNIERWGAYLTYIKNNCSWMTEARPNGNGGYWKVKNLEYFITEKCYLMVKEDRASDV